MKFEHTFSKGSLPARNCSSPCSAKLVGLQRQDCSSPAQNAFVASDKCIPLNSTLGLSPRLRISLSQCRQAELRIINFSARKVQRPWPRQPLRFQRLCRYIRCTTADFPEWIGEADGVDRRANGLESSGGRWWRVCGFDGKDSLTIKMSFDYRSAKQKFVKLLVAG